RERPARRPGRPGRHGTGPARRSRPPAQVAGAGGREGAGLCLLPVLRAGGPAPPRGDLHAVAEGSRRPPPPSHSRRLAARGGLGLGGGITWYAAGGLGLEARVDTADVSVRSIDAIVRVRLPLPPPLPSLSTDVNIPATADLQRLWPVSLNLAARTSG